MIVNTTFVSSTVEIPIRIPNQTCERIFSITEDASKAVQHCLLIGGCIQLEHRSVTVQASHNSSTVKVSCPVADQARRWPFPIAPSSGKAVQYCIDTIPIYLKHRSAAKRAGGYAAPIRCAVEIPLLVSPQTCIRP